MFADVQKLGAVIVGVSLDSLALHRKFAAANDIPYPLVSDADHHITAEYGVDISAGWARRVTFVINRKGVIAKVFPDVDVRGHAAEVLAALRALPKH